jgi:pimeloyl-ACP methyl ester carboxylesterase
MEDSRNHFLTMQELLKDVVPHVDQIVSTDEGRRRATEFLATNYEHIPADLIAHQITGAANCPAVFDLVGHAKREGWGLEAERIGCPVRVVWGTADRILEWPSAAVRYREEWLPKADWVVLDGVGHSPQLDVPLETAELILGFTR